MSKKLSTRAEVDKQYTWNLKDLFSSEEQYEAALAKVQEDVVAFETTYKGKLADDQVLLEGLRAYQKIAEQLVPIETYARLSLSGDQTDDEAQMRSNKLASISSKIGSSLSFVRSELMNLETEKLTALKDAEPDFMKYFEQIIRGKPYQLAPEVEKTLAAYASTFQAPYSLYNTTKLVDLKFDDFTVDDNTYSLSYTTFEGDLESTPDTNVRRAAYKAFYSQLQNYEHTTAKTYDTLLQTEKTTADLRGYDSIFDYLLHNQEVDRSMYNRQIDLIMNELAPHMRKYAKLLKRIHKLDQMTFADLKIPLDPAYEPKITVEESKKHILEGLSIMGDHYLGMVERAYDERWIDFVKNIGKSTGAFCASPYGHHPYILISWTGSMEDVFVLAHELGHAGHFYHANDSQSILNARPSLYFIEAPSTMNEMLLANHLLKNTDDLRFKRWVISSIVSRTYYHNFVTHLLEGDYQRKVYEIIDAGGSVNANVLNKLKRETLEQFWGDTVEINDGAERTWMRQPHYYMGLYPYTYSAGLTVSTEMAKRVLNEGQSAVEDWINVLNAGGTKDPIGLAKMANIDITTDEPLKNTIAYIGELIDELVQLTDELEGQ